MVLQWLLITATVLMNIYKEIDLSINKEIIYK